MLYWICVIYIFGIWIQYGLCATRADAKALRTELFVTRSYDVTVRPSDDQRNPIKVSLDLSLWSIIELSEVTETMKITAVLAIRWLDPFLEWNPDQYGGISSYQWPQGDVWKPEIVLKNSNQQYKEIGMPSMNVNIVANGYVGWYPFQVFESTCNIDIMYFPFDVQECKLEFVVWNYSSDEVNLTSEDKEIDMDEFQENSEWTVIDTGYKVDPESPYSAVIYTIKLKRKPLYYLLSIIMPIVMLAVLNIFAFVLPSESGEKASYAITVFLSFTVLQTIFATSVPKNSEVVPLFAIYVIILTLQSTMITLLTLVSVRYCSFDAKVDPVPRWIRAFLRIVGCRPCRETRYLKVRRNSEPEEDITRKHEKPEPTDVSRSNDYTWKEVVNLFDRIGFVLFTMFLVTETIVFFYVTVNNK